LQLNLNNVPWDFSAVQVQSRQRQLRRQKRTWLPSRFSPRTCCSGRAD